MSICYSCFKEFEDGYDVCPYCGEVHQVTPVEPIHLYPGTILMDRYVIGTAVGSGGFGIIYKAWDRKLETVVAVKEFFASRLVTRAVGQNSVIVSKKSAEEFEYRKTRFLAEARNMAKFGKHRSIPNVFEFFEANGTAYIVMELLHGEALNRYLHENGGKVDKDFAVFVTNEVGKALSSMHEKGIIHRDVAPDNIFICSGSDIRIKLLDLGAAKLADSPDDVVDIILKPGYSPVEQYDNTKNVGTWSDVYALGATMYVMLTGIKPEESTNRKIEDHVVPPHEIDASIPENLSNAVMKAMAIERHMRFKTVDDFLKAINGERKVMSLAKEKKLRKRRRFTGIFAASFVVLLVGAFVFYTYESKKNKEVLDDATISVWYSVQDGSTENLALESVKEDFTEKYPNIKIELSGIPEADYETQLKTAADNGTLPTLFESSGVSEDILKKASNVDAVLESDMAKDSLFLDQYDNYYSEHKQIPLGFEVPMAIVITNGVKSVDYKNTYFKSPDDFGKKELIAYDEEYDELVEKDFANDGYKSRDTFFDNESNQTAVLLTSSMAVNEARGELTNYTKEFVYPDSDKIHGRFLYEWSIGDGSKDEKAAAEKLLSWMLGNVYQNTLMISQANDGQIPLNKTTFDEKTTQNNYAPLKEIRKKIVFKK